ncbi:hypothetical protein FACS189460_0610 [Deltaproteobacteria bacterium]|nr:hypothetical protein FACS189460_0610 [Deltaproteobacteria bacterium]
MKNQSAKKPGRKPIKAHANKWAGVYFYELNNLWNGKPDRCYYFTYRHGRKMVWKKVGKLSEGFGPEVAADLRAKTIMGLSSGQEVLTPKEEREDRDRRDKTFKEIADLYFDTKGTELKGLKTDKNRFEIHLASRFGSQRIGRIEPEHIENLKKELKTRKPATIWNILELLRRIINFGHRTNRCPALKFQIEMPRKDNEVLEYLTPEEARRFLAVVREWPDPDARNMLLVAYFTGLRRGEIFKLEEADVDFHLKLIRVRAPKGGKTVSIGLSVVVADIIQEQLAWKRGRFPESPYIFPGRSGGLRTDCGAVDRIKKSAGLPTSFRPFHGLRHHFAVSLANSGQFTINMISEALTHKNLDFTKRKYAQFLPETLAGIGNAAAQVLEFKEGAA